MSNFDIYKWNRERHLIEGRLNEEKSKNDRIFDLFFNELEDFDGVADYLNRYRSTIMRGLSSIDFDYLDKPSMMEEVLTVGDLKLDDIKGKSLPFPNSDASLVINNQKDLDRYIADFGADLEIVMGKYGRYEAPAFKDGRDKAAATKAAGIKKFGTSA